MSKKMFFSEPELEKVSRDALTLIDNRN